jgi:large subunit ribosomal protein L29
MKIVEMRKKTKKELNDMLQGSKAKLRSLRFDLASGKVKNVREIRKIKKDIARILTITKQAK